jgi:hypothetical protein
MDLHFSYIVFIYDRFQVRNITRFWNHQSVRVSKISCLITNSKLLHLLQLLYMSCNVWNERINLNK